MQYFATPQKLTNLSKAGSKVLSFVVLSVLASCTSMEGDLGRPQRNTAVESLMTTGGKARAKFKRELYSDFNTTDEEILMRDKAWILIRPPHAQDWVSDDLWNFLPSTRNVGLHILTAAQRTRLSPVIDTAFNPKHYYRTLRSSRYASHHVRYDRVTNDILEDYASFNAFVPTAERVVTMDNERMAALGRLADMEPREMKDAYARVDENRRFIGWVWRSLQFRLRAYAYAIKRLEVETPSPKVADANKALKLLSDEFDKQNGGINEGESAEDRAGTRKSRYTRRQWAKDNPDLVK